ncbi:phosphoribosylamine--glycine ligase [Lacibacterium aquatile]|uniref:Phosphoribosylamine--glycine ligase n=1 Tax=Lacibacterium aquatile TaxID=1168082 RepID=A0ABW5DKX8_9PROT
MKVLVVGGGGREHALVWKLKASPLVSSLYCAPGNPGIANSATCVPIAASDVAGIVDFAKQEGIGFVVVGPEEPLTLGIVDALAEAGIPAFGPDKSAARLEGSKGFMKDLAAKAGVPTAKYQRFTDAEAAKAYIRAEGAPIVVKADGLAAGKGVTVALTVDEAIAAVSEAMEDGRFGAAGAEVVVEEFLEGEEVSFFALVDGKTALPLIGAQDHKRAFDGDQGPNTGGMGAYSPAPIFTLEMERRTMEEIVLPTVRTMAAEGCAFKGVLFAGLMITKAGPKLIEYNVRFGDPECEVLMRRMQSDLFPLLVASQKGTLGDVDVRWWEDPALVVILAGAGYPGEPKKGGEITGIEAADSVDGVMTFHAGTTTKDGKLVANGGRVLAVTAMAPTLAEARTAAYAGVDKIQWADGFCRRDIAWRALG